MHDLPPQLRGKVRRRTINSSPVIEQSRPPAYSDDALALTFADRHADELRYVARVSRWYSWTGTVWRVDDTLRTFDLSRIICREAAAKCGRDKLAALVASAKTVAAVERLARADRRIAATIEQFDADPWQLNTPNGIVDLRDSAIRPAMPHDYVSKCTAVAPAGECPIWIAFLERITGNNTELVSYVQRLFGYALTGVTNEHMLAFLFGLGANGKSVLMSTIAGILADYHKTAPVEAFTATISERHSTDLAGLMGARLVTANETEQGQRWAEAKIKALTGGDPITARFMRQDNFTYRPQFKLVIAGNHKPRLSSVDEAIRRRLHLVPFMVTIPANERDPELTEKLKAEWPGILRWLIAGCLEWQRRRLAAPEIIRTATAEYLASEDATSAWIIESCELRPMAFESVADLFASWVAWANRNGEEPRSRKQFQDRLRTYPQLAEKRTENARGFIGLSLKGQSDDRLG